MLRATIQTAGLARHAGARIDYMVIPAEAERAMAAEVAAIGEREWARTWEPLDRRAFGGLCNERRLDHPLDVELICLLPAGHQPPCGWYRFLDAVERGQAEVDAAAARIQARFDAALDEARRRIDPIALRHVAEAVAKVDPLDTLRRAYADLDLDAGADED